MTTTNIATIEMGKKHCWHTVYRNTWTKDGGYCCHCGLTEEPRGDYSKAKGHGEHYRPTGVVGHKPPNDACIERSLEDIHNSRTPLEKMLDSGRGIA